MKILYSELKKYIPELKADLNEVKEVLAMLGHLIDKVDEVKFDNKDDILIDYETRHNRADLLSVIGICRDLASYYGYKVPYDNYELPKIELKSDLILVEAVQEVRKVIAVEIKNVKVKESSKWLKDYLSYYGINPINNLVDISNYVMLITGYPSHILDIDKAMKPLIWKNTQHKEITTLSGETLQLDETIISIEDNEDILALAGIIGGQKAKVDNTTNNIIAEMAIYKPSTVRKNSIQLTTRTEASVRLEKELDAKQLEKAFAMLVHLIKNETESSEIVGKQEYENIESKDKKEITLEYKKVSDYAGIDIDREKINNILVAIGCEIISKTDENIVLLAPDDRHDLKSEIEIIEELIRKNGYYEIPHTEQMYLREVKDITPPYVQVIEKIRDTLPILGYDEVLNWPLIDSDNNSVADNGNKTPILVENSVNDGVPELRKSISSAMLKNLEIYRKRDIRDINIFEIGPVWWKENEKYHEHIGVGLLSSNSLSIGSLENMRTITESLLNHLGVSDCTYKKLEENIPKIANKYSCYEIYSNSKAIGTLYKCKIGKTYIVELNLTQISELIKSDSRSEMVLQNKINWIDKNIEIETENADTEILKLVEMQKKENDFVSIVDKYKLTDKTRYTIRTGNK